MKIYTKTGDAGETGLFGGSRVPKDHARIQTYGTLDELNSVLGIVLSSDGLDQTLQKSFLRIQGELFQLGAELATPSGKTVKSKLISQQETQALELEIDSMESKLSPLKTFILPGGTKASAAIHLARSVSRRAERELVSLAHAEVLRNETLIYLNRLSDYLFVCARFQNLQESVSDIPWHG